MNQILSLQHHIQPYITMGATATSLGWHTCVCKLCNDYKKRAGFKFEGSTTSYHCFNCGHGAIHSADQYYTINDDMQKVLDAFNVPRDSYQEMLFEAMVQITGKSTSTNAVKKVVDPDTKLIEIHTPEFFIPLSQSSDTWSIVANEYLLLDRGISPNDHTFWIMVPKKQDQQIEDRWRGRLIIPYFRDSKLVWYQGRDLTDNPKRVKYLNVHTSSDCVLSNFAALTCDTEAPLYVVEGVFDAMSIDGVAIFGNKMSVGQIKMLQSSKRPKVYVPDTKGDGHMGATQAIQLGWGVSIPDMGNCKDLNQAVHKYGKLYTKKSLLDATRYGDFARIEVTYRCEPPTKKRHTNVVSKK